uniref:Uncharacterized protein n=1 Tax=Panagrolaimus davidi TaxID=227884 RepID=A0A914PPV8_9BILA
MKIGCVLFYLILLSIFLQASVAVQCGRNTVDPANPTVIPTNTSFVQCSACVGYGCANMDKVDADGLPNNLIAAGSGCPEDFFHDCANFTKEIEFIIMKRISITLMHMLHMFLDGLRFPNQLKSIKDFKLGEVIWNSADGTTHRLDASGAEIKNAAAKNQNDALKFIGIFALTWILSSFM